MKRMLSTIILASLLSVPVTAAHAVEVEAGTAAQLVAFTPAPSDKEKDNRAEKLRSFLVSQNSPIADEAEHFVSEADRNDLDWRLVAAISGVESTFGQFIPYGSFNGWGWGIPTGAQSGVIFKDWKDAITTISEGLRKNYYDRGANSIEQVGNIYAASPAWPWKVRFFMQKIDSFAIPPQSMDVTL